MRPASAGLLGGGADVPLPGGAPRALPPHIPVIPDPLPVRMHVRSLIGVHGEKAFTSNGENLSRVIRERGLQRALNLEKPVRGVLHFYVKDRVLEGFFDNRKEIYKQLKNEAWAAVISPNFSVYEDTPRLDHLYNIKRSRLVYSELLEAGLPAVADISWFDRSDLDAWARDIRRGGVRAIAFSFQTVGAATKGANDFADYLQGFRYLVSRIPDFVEIIIAGVVSPKRVSFLFEGCENKLSVLHQAAYVHSRRGVFSASRKKAPPGVSKEALLSANTDYYDMAYAAMAKKQGGFPQCPREERTP
jgi:hypothetical protein